MTTQRDREAAEAAYLAIGSPVDNFSSALTRARAEGVELLSELAKHRNWSLEYVYPDDAEPAYWAVFSESGSINDREWTEIGHGESPQEALSSALSNRQQPANK